MNDVRDHYDRWHESLPAEDEPDAPWHEMAKGLLRQNVGILRGGRILEIGCGRGGFTRWLEQEGLGAATIIGADFSPAAVKRASSIANSPKGVFDLQMLPVADSSLRALVSLETVEHLPDPPKAFREMHRVLEQDGLLVVTTPNYFNTMGLYRGYLRLRGTPYTEVGQPINRFTSVPRTIHWLRSAGFRDIGLDGVGHYWLMPGRSPKRVHLLDGARWLSRWSALHTMFWARK